MLARRFTIVCLITAVCGMLLASLVAGAGHSVRQVVVGEVVPCVVDAGIRCTPPRPS